MDNIEQIFKDLNEAYGNIYVAFSILDKYKDLNPEINLYYWRIHKNLNALQKSLYEELRSQDIYNQFRNITDKFDE